MHSVDKRSTVQAQLTMALWDLSVVQDTACRVDITRGKIVLGILAGMVAECASHVVLPQDLRQGSVSSGASNLRQALV